MIATLRNRHVLIAPLRDEDLPLYVSLYVDPDTMRHIGPTLTPAAAEAGFAAAMRSNAQAEPTTRTWTVARASDGVPRGLLALLHFGASGTRGEAELGALFGPASHGGGHAGHALLAAVRHAFADLGMTTLYGRHRDTHRVAMQVVEKLGFTRMPDPADPNTCVWCLARSEWRPRDRPERLQCASEPLR